MSQASSPSTPGAGDPAVTAFSVIILLNALRRLAARLLSGEAEPTVTHYRLVERLMRIAITLAGAGNARHPHIQIHQDAPGDESATLLPRVTRVDLPDLLAARAADHLPAALAGDESARAQVEAIAEHILLTEDIQLG
ncbi:MAG TPA: hypothetical protein VG406_09650 [Isosphaeraceae bacterium]|jgi:hypothetical protein|nr:hypothetical protein [Isosphaeraceae bacterium]